MTERRASVIDRRSGEDRRMGRDVHRLPTMGIERRDTRERRSQVERRVGWMRVSEWFSVCLGDSKITKMGYFEEKGNP